MQRIKRFFEKQAFGVCEYLGNKMNIPSSTIRMYFIYAAFATLGSPIIIYMAVAFWLKVKKYVLGRRPSVWDL